MLPRKSSPAAAGAGKNAVAKPAKAAPAAQPAAQPAASAAAQPALAPAPAPSGPTVGSQQHFVDAVGQENTVVYFDTDRFNIDAEDQAKLQRQAQYFNQYSGVTFTVEGHCDERGTRDYNLALGERRANAAKNYLVSIGIPANRIRTVSYGKERPVALGSNEAAWAQNRRAATVTIG